MEDQGPTVIWVNSLCLGLSLLAVGARCYTRLYITRAFGVDDGIILFSMAIFIGLSVTGYLGVHAGLGRHSSGLTDHQIKESYKYIFLGQLLYVTLTSLIKFSIGWTLLRLGLSRRYTYIISIALIINTCTFLTVFFNVLLTCNPISYVWSVADPVIRAQNCKGQTDINHIGYALSCMTITLDLLFAILPVFILWNLQLSWQVKVSTITILSFGFLASIATFVRIKYFVQLTNNSDVIYMTSYLIIWSVVECGMGIVGSSLATLRALVRKLGHKGFSQKGIEKSQYQQSSRSTPLVPQGRDAVLDTRCYNGSIQSENFAQIEGMNSSQDNILAPRNEGLVIVRKIDVSVDEQNKNGSIV